MTESDSTIEKLRVAAIGDLHVKEDSVAPYREMFSEISSAADVLVLCGDLTNFGKTNEAEILAEDIRSCSIPVIGVLGNHDFECGQPEKVCAILHEAGMMILDEQAHEIAGVGFRRSQRLSGRLWAVASSRRSASRASRPSSTRPTNERASSKTAFAR